MVYLSDGVFDLFFSVQHFVAKWMIHLTASVRRDKANRNLPASNMLVQLLALLCTPTPRATMHIVPDRQMETC